MAVTTDTAFATKKTGIIDWIGNALVALGDMSEGAKAARYAAALTKMSDAQLDAIGVKRENIVEHAFQHLRQG